MGNSSNIFAAYAAMDSGYVDPKTNKVHKKSVSVAEDLGIEVKGALKTKIEEIKKMSEEEKKNVKSISGAYREMLGMAPIEEQIESDKPKIIDVGTKEDVVEDEMMDAYIVKIKKGV